MSNKKRATAVKKMAAAQRILANTKNCACMPVRLRSSVTPLPPDYPNGDTKICIKNDIAKYSAQFRHLLNSDIGYQKKDIRISEAAISDIKKKISESAKLRYRISKKRYPNQRSCDIGYQKKDIRISEAAISDIKKKIS